MTNSTPITEADIHAYVDGELSPKRQSEVEGHLRKHPEDAIAAKAYQEINQSLKQLYDPIMEEPVPPHLVQRTPNRRLWAVAAAVAWMSIGAALSWGLTPSMERKIAQESHKWDLLEPNLVQPAAFAHTVYTPEVHHPVEVSSEDEQHLVAWLSKRLHTDIQAPNLKPQGYQLVGGRLLPSTNRMAAQFMYERDDGQRATLYVRHGVWENDTTAFRFEQEDSLGIFYWVDSPLGYALIGDLERSELQRLSEAVYEQL
jgi:anti-sigma factor RsiW